MKKIKKLKLGQLSRNLINPEQLDQIKGGAYCQIGYGDQRAHAGGCSCFCRMDQNYYGEYGVVANQTYCRNL